MAMKYCLYLFILFVCHSVFAIEQKRDLKVAVYIEPPFVGLDGDELVGYNIDIVKLLSKQLNLNPVFILCPFARCLVLVKQGEADMILGLKKLADREKYLIFLEPPYMVQHYPLRFFTLASKNTTINNFADLTRLTVGTMRGASYFELFDQNKAINRVELTSREQLVNMLLRGRIDTFIEREESIIPLLPKDDYKEKLSLASYQYNQAVNSYIAISKKSDLKADVKAISNQLKKLVESGTIKSIRVTSAH